MTAALELIRKRAEEHIKKGWSQGASARDDHGHAVPYYSSYAVSWCLAGALMLARDELGVGNRPTLGDTLKYFTSPRMSNLPNYNDYYLSTVEGALAFLSSKEIK